MRLDDDKIYYTVSRLPNRKQKALVRVRGTNLQVIAFFTSDRTADQFIDEVAPAKLEASA